MNTSTVIASDTAHPNFKPEIGVRFVALCVPCSGSHAGLRMDMITSFDSRDRFDLRTGAQIMGVRSAHATGEVSLVQDGTWGVAVRIRNIMSAQGASEGEIEAALAAA